MKTRRFDFNWKPLQLQLSLSVEGSVPGKQNYNADTDEYTPDYTLTPLIIQPRVSILDKDEVLDAGSVNNQLVNVKWYETIGGTKSLIQETDTNYEITTGGSEAGRLKVKKNAQPNLPITLTFYAEFLDNRNSQISVIQGTMLVVCGSATESVRVELDAADQTTYNPLEDERTQTITATVYVGGKVCEASKYELVWEVMEADGTWRSIDKTANVEDRDITAIGAGSITIDKWLTGDETHIRCRVKYSSEGEPSSVTLTDASPCAEVAFVRVIPKYEFDIDGVPYNIPPGQEELAPNAIVRGTKGIIANAEDELFAIWYMATNKRSGSLSYTQVAEGMNPVINTDKMDSTYGAVMGLDVVDRGKAGALTDVADGKALLDGDGALLIIH